MNTNDVPTFIAVHPPKARWLPLLFTALACALSIVLTRPLLKWVEPTNIAMLFLLVVLAVSFLWGRGAGILSAVLLVAGFDFFFVEPHLTFAVSDAQYVITFVVMLLVAIVISYLVSELRVKQLMTQLQASQTAALYGFSKSLMQTLKIDDVALTTADFLKQHLGFDACVLYPEHKNSQRLVATQAGFKLAIVEQTYAETLYHENMIQPNHQHEAYFENEGQSSMFIVLQGSTRARGVLLVYASGQSFEAMRQARPMLDAVASMVAIAIERLHYIAVANQHQWQMESERLRGSILSALSHDIRTPLTAMYGVADGLHWLEPTPAPAVIAAADKLCAQTLQLNQMVTNLLDFTKLYTEPVQLQRAWIPIDELVGCSMRALVQPLSDVRVDVNLPNEGLVQVDPVLFERVLANLLDNAIKFNALPAGQKRIQLNAQFNEPEGLWRIEVINPAVHLSEHQLHTMFDVFERLAVERTELGAGLGLSIARTIVRAHGGAMGALNTTLDAQLAVSVFVEIPVGTPPTWAEEMK